jgi:SWI/SNF-related matrix-associated actin-dependent regulator of chromatin subfamily B protein 1
VEQLQAAEYYNEDMRILIKLDIIIGQHQLVDQFEWDMNCPYNSPEQFAQTMCNDLCLPGEFANSIAHSIREQTQIHTKTLFLVGHSFDGRPVEDEEVRKEILPQVRVEGLIRPNASLREYTPQLFEIPEAELDRVDKDRDRDSRRKRRQGRASRRGAAQLPDLHETMRTYCSPVYNGLLPGGIDKNLEIFRKQIKAGDSDDEDSTSRRFRPLPGPFTSRRDILGSPGDIGPPTPPIRIVPGEHYVIKLKVPRLREWLARRQQQPFVK